MLTAVDYIGYNCACCRKLACTLAVEYYIACAVASYHNAVELIVNVSKLALVRNEHRSNDNVNLAVRKTLNTADKFNYAMESLSVSYIFKCNFCNALCMYRVGINMLSVCKRCKNTNLAASVVTFDISGRISLGKAKLLSKLECIVKLHTVFNHLCKDKVCCTVKNTGNLVNIVCDKTLAHRADNRNTTAYRCFKEEVCVCFL